MRHSHPLTLRGAGSPSQFSLTHEHERDNEPHDHEVTPDGKTATSTTFFKDLPEVLAPSRFDFPRLRKMLDECVRTLNDVVVAQTKDDGFDMPVGIWKAIEQADILVNSARDAIPTRTVVRYPAWIDVTVDTRAEDDHTIVKSVAMAQQSDASSFGPNTRPYVTEAEDQDLADAALRYTELSVWPDPKLEG